MQAERRKHIIRGIIAIVIGALYLLNPTGGVVELIPDVLPLAGNLDEAAATALLIYGIAELRGKPKTLPQE